MGLLCNFFSAAIQTRRQLQNTEIEPRMLQVEWRLMAIPMLFILLRMWGTIQLIVSLSLPSNKDAPCITPQLRDVYLALGILQVSIIIIIPIV